MKKFTIIELLIVIAIIGILASMLLPAISKVRLKARQAVCLSNQRQTFTATFSYITENNNYAPFDNHWSAAKDNWKNKTWYNRLIPGYLPPGTKIVDGASDVNFCPDGQQDSNKWESTIAMNTLISGTWQRHYPNIDPSPVTRATPDETMIFMDSYGAFRGLWPGHLKSENLLNTNTKNRVVRHLGKANVTYLDGHATARPYKYFLGIDASHTFLDHEK
ncbi:MAG: type II secretion system GspH family protein [Lentisphaeraceae bacterium]|nr:type II secretion system GspH family protein [Lentisphaeraceae bacterium]